jgi:hypothetical protein
MLACFECVCSMEIVYCLFDWLHTEENNVI